MSASERASIRGTPKPSRLIASGPSTPFTWSVPRVCGSGARSSLCQPKAAAAPAPQRAPIAARGSRPATRRFSHEANRRGARVAAVHFSGSVGESGEELAMRKLMIVAILLVAACAPASNASATTWSGSCHLTGRVDFVKPVGPVVENNGFLTNASGTCTGTLDGKPYDGP